MSPRAPSADEARAAFEARRNFGKDGVHHPGIAVTRTTTIESARVSSVFYYAID